MFKYRITKLEDVAENLRGFYQPDPAGNGYVLAVEGAVDKGKLDEFRNANVELKQKLEAGTATLQELEAFKKQFGDHDIQHILDALEVKRRAEEKELIDKGEIDKLIEKRTSEMKNSHKSELSRFQQELAKASDNSQKYRSMYQNLLTESKIREGIAAVGVLKAGADIDVINRAKINWMLADDDNLVAMNNGEPMFSAEDATKPLSIEEWASNLARQSPYLFESTTGMGGKGGQPAGGKGGQQVSGFVQRGDEAAKSANLEAIAAGKVQII